MEENKTEEIGVSVTESDGKSFILKQVRDSYDFTHIITKELGRGGQGMVCLTENPEVVVKFVLDTKGNVIGREKDKDRFEKNDAEIKSIIHKPFPPRIHLAYPVARLADYSGYVMRLMGDMTSFSELVPFDADGIKRMADDGGHRRRFLLLSKLAALLSRLHGSGMVYCDISPNNVFVTKNPSYPVQNVWLIDADNVFLPGEDADKLVYTPRYAAPELLGGKPCTQASDCYSFAVLAFESLAAIHPFRGKKTEEDDSADDWDAESKEKDSEPEPFPEYSGKIPWVEDVEDDSNHTDNGLPRQNFLTDETFRLFNETFSESGRTSPKKRPASPLWARAFAHSYAMSVQCSAEGCGMSFVHDENHAKCPWCGENVRPIFTLSCGGKTVFAHEVNFRSYSEGEWFSLPEFLFLPFSIESCFKALLKVRTVERNGSGIEILVSQEAGSEHSFFIQTTGKTGKTEEKISPRYTLFLQDGEQYTLRYHNSLTDCERTFVLNVSGL